MSRNTMLDDYIQSSWDEAMRRLCDQQKAEDEERMWKDHYRHKRELESVLDEMGVKHQKVKERQEWVKK